jgi:hypothetical protein
MRRMPAVSKTMKTATSAACATTSARPMPVIGALGRRA